ncbi:Vacuolar protein sorting-associated protein 41 [Ranunculus cassubicifolius]
MANSPFENGGDGDDEREEEEEEEEEDGAEEDEEEEDEPRLKYQRLGGSISSLLASDAASCIAVAERMIALGTHDGTIHILDVLGNQVKVFAAHTATVNDLSFDTEGEYIGSCSDDGNVVINSLFTDEKMKFEYHRPMKAIALDPDYSRKSSRRFAAGGLAGKLLLNAKGWLRFSDQVLHSGEGPIHAVNWRTNLIAWANDAGVKVYDTANDQRITFIERPRGSPRPELLLPHLVWQDDSLLVIGWGTSIKVAAIRANQYRGANGIQMHAAVSSTQQVDVVASFQTSYSISGIAPYGDALVGTAQRPEVRIVTWKNEELAMDALPVHGFEHYKAKDYCLAHAPFSAMFVKEYIMTLVHRDAEDHISWLLQHGWHEKALAAVEAGQGRTELLDEVGSRYLDHMILERKYAEAASLCPKLLRGSASAWERWVFSYAQLRQLPVLVPYIPVDNPRLRDTAYEVALVALARNSSYHKDLLATVKSWPSVIYSVLPVISAIEPQLNTSTMTNTLKEALAELYIINGEYEKSLSLYADLMKPELFEFIEKYNLHDAILDKVVQLMTLDSKRAVPLLIQYRDLISPSEVVSQLSSATNKSDTRSFLYLYLHSLFVTNPDDGKEFHDMQVELYADFDAKMLLPFLRSSQHYRLEKAYEVCVQRDLLREQVFILGRMGNAKQALAVIINKLGDIEEAIEFVSSQHDDDLWEELIQQCLNKPEMVGVLLEHTVGNLDPLYIVNLVPNGLVIPRLRDRLVKIITDYRTETSLRNGCNDILKTDVVNLLVKYYKEARRAILIDNEEDEVRAKRGSGNRNTTREMVPEKKFVSMKGMQIKSRTRGGGRCCLCFDPFSIQNISIIAFFCCHAYHVNCLKESTNSSIGHDDEDDDERSSTPKMRCILCTTAAQRA